MSKINTIIEDMEKEIRLELELTQESMDEAEEPEKVNDYYKGMYDAYRMMLDKLHELVSNK